MNKLAGEARRALTREPDRRNCVSPEWQHHDVGILFLNGNRENVQNCQR